MSHRKVVENYYADINSIADLISKLVNSYRLLVGGAHELNSVALAHKKDIKDALERAEELGKIIDELLDTLKDTGAGYIEYCKLKSSMIKGHIEPQYIESEIEAELKLKE
ncbi:hypothetical protein [Clostridium thermarum]|uniref:hypothetical protein n=1 Tax=Clostridium thermarum TaxID=1716543 RepID=UPI0013D83404|nr:hypothetical protein [Clostridium thermarum]